MPPFRKTGHGGHAKDRVFTRVMTLRPTSHRLSICNWLWAEKLRLNSERPVDSRLSHWLIQQVSNDQCSALALHSKHWRMTGMLLFLAPIFFNHEAAVCRDVSVTYKRNWFVWWQCKFASLRSTLIVSHGFTTSFIYYIAAIGCLVWVLYFAFLYITWKINETRGGIYIFG